jgi:Ohr subfamily peroxiredoxin
MSKLYTANVTTTAGREGTSKSDDGVLNLKQGKPGAKDGSTNPEQLFAAGYSACFGSALMAVAKRDKVDVGDISVQAEVTLNQEESKGYFISAVLTTTIGGVDDATARQLTEEAHKMCPYSKATRGNIDVQLNAKGTGTKAAA